MYYAVDNQGYKCVTLLTTRVTMCYDVDDQGYNMYYAVEDQGYNMYYAVDDHVLCTM